MYDNNVCTIFNSTVCNCFKLCMPLAWCKAALVHSKLWSPCHMTLYKNVFGFNVLITIIIMITTYSDELKNNKVKLE